MDHIVINSDNYTRLFIFNAYQVYFIGLVIYLFFYYLVDELHSQITTLSSHNNHLIKYRKVMRDIENFNRLHLIKHEHKSIDNSHKKYDWKYDLGF